MPLFELGDESGVYIPATRDVFRRGVRLDDVTRRRIRDELYTLLVSLGMDVEDAAMIFRRGVCARQIRNRISRVPTKTQSRISRIAHEILVAQRKAIDEAPARVSGEEERRWRPPTRRRTGSIIGQLWLPISDQAASSPAGSAASAATSWSPSPRS